MVSLPSSSSLSLMENNNGDLGHWASIVSYRKCHKNHAISQPGGHRRHLYDGGLEFMNIVEENNEGNPMAALLCASRGCRQNFHRREKMLIRVAPRMDHIHGDMAAATPLLQLPILALSHSAPADPAGGGDGGENPNEDEYLGDGEVEEEREPMRRRREKARLTSEQKAAMREYATETLEWSLQGHNEEELIQFCSDIRIVPQVFKVWMRNNRDRYMDAGEASSVDEV